MILTKKFPGTTAAYKRKSYGSLRENYRIIFGKGSVIKFMSDGSYFIMHSNGNTCVSDGDGFWITTNNKGLRKKKDVKNNIEIELGEIPTVSKSTSPNEEYPKVWLREDQVKIILYKDKRRLVLHHDGTKILTFADGKTFVVEHENFATVRVDYRESQFEVQVNPDPEAFVNEIFAGLDYGGRMMYGCGDLLRRSANERTCEVYLPDGNKIVSAIEMNCSNDNIENVVYFECFDQSIIKCKQSGKIVVIPPENKFNFSEKAANIKRYLGLKNFLHRKIDIKEREMLAKKDNVSEKKSSKDTEPELKEELAREVREYDASINWNEGIRINDRTEYFRQLNIETHDELLPGVYVIDLLEKCINCKDDEDKLFKIYDDGEFQVECDHEFDEDRNSFYYDFDSLRPLDIQPRLFVVNNDNTAYELLNKEILDYFENNLVAGLPAEKSRTRVKNSVEDYRNCKNESYLIRNCSIEAKQRYDSTINLPLPTHIDIFPIREDKQGNEKPLMNYLITRNLYKFSEIGTSDWQEFLTNLEVYENWAKANIK